MIFYYTIFRPIRLHPMTTKITSNIALEIAAFLETEVFPRTHVDNVRNIPQSIPLEDFLHTPNVPETCDYILAPYKNNILGKVHNHNCRLPKIEGNQNLNSFYNCLKPHFFAPQAFRQSSIMNRIRGFKQERFCSNVSRKISICSTIHGSLSDSFAADSRNLHINSICNRWDLHTPSRKPLVTRLNN